MTPPEAPARWPGALYALITLAACVGAFVGLSASSLWIDELFTVHLIHHHGGLGEVFRRALTDTHPPFYYFLLYGWTRLAGFSEAALRLPSAVFAVLAIGIFAAGMRRVLSPTALAFACAVAALSSFWFDQSQNVRSYALCMAMASALLAIAVSLRRRVRVRPGFPLAHWIALSLLGLAASLTHAYLLLALGMVLLFLVLDLPSWRIRTALVATGLLVLACNIAYYRQLMHATQQDLHHLWFSNAPGFFVHEIRLAISELVSRQILLVVVVLLALACQRRVCGDPLFVHDEADTRWTAGLAAFVLAGVIACGIGISLLVAPSFSERNVLTCAPFAWLLAGRLYDAVGPRGHSRRSAVLAAIVVLLVGSHLLLLRGRSLPRTEAWRASAHYVQQLPGCAGRPLPGILPYRFGHASPYFRMLAVHDFFGHYLPDTARPRAYLPAELAARHPVAGLPSLLATRAAHADDGGCTLLAWGVHDLEETDALKVAMDLARQPGVAPRRVLVQEFDAYQHRRLKWYPAPKGYVFLAIPKAQSGAPLQPPPAADIRLAGSDALALGNRVVVSYLTSYPGTDGPPYMLDVYSIQRWSAHAVREDFVAVQRLACDPPTATARSGVWPDPASPGCSDRPLPGGDRL